MRTAPHTKVTLSSLSIAYVRPYLSRRPVVPSKRGYLELASIFRMSEVSSWAVQLAMILGAGRCWLPGCRADGTEPFVATGIAQAVRP